MLKEILVNLNWVDILTGCILVRCIYSGVKKGLVFELFKWLGMLFATFIAIHYYVRLALSLQHLVMLPTVMGEPLAFIFLWLMVVGIFKLIRDGWMIILKVEPTGAVQKWGGLILAFPRAALISGLILILIFIIGHPFLTKGVRNSLSGFPLARLSIRIYEGSFNLVVSKLFLGEKKNEKTSQFKDMLKAR